MKTGDILPDNAGNIQDRIEHAQVLLDFFRAFCHKCLVPVSAVKHVVQILAVFPDDVVIIVNARRVAVGKHDLLIIKGLHQCFQEMRIAAVIRFGDPEIITGDFFQTFLPL